MKYHIREDTRGPSTAQNHLRDLACSKPANLRNVNRGIWSQPVVVSRKEGGQLEFQDVMDYGNRSGEAIGTLQINVF